jgi:effector-binding domain-containing protein
MRTTRQMRDQFGQPNVDAPVRGESSPIRERHRQRCRRRAPRTSRDVRGPHDDIDTVYGALGAYVTAQALSVEGPVREYYLVGAHTTPYAARWRTELGWPVFGTGRPIHTA